MASPSVPLVGDFYKETTNDDDIGDNGEQTPETILKRVHQELMIQQRFRRGNHQDNEEVVDKYALNGGAIAKYLDLPITSPSWPVGSCEVHPTITELVSFDLFPTWAPAKFEQDEGWMIQELVHLQRKGPLSLRIPFSKTYDASYGSMDQWLRHIWQVLTRTSQLEPWFESGRKLDMERGTHLGTLAFLPAEIREQVWWEVMKPEHPLEADNKKDVQILNYEHNSSSFYVVDDAKWPVHSGDWHAHNSDFDHVRGALCSSASEIDRTFLSRFRFQFDNAKVFRKFLEGVNPNVRPVLRVHIRAFEDVEDITNEHDSYSQQRYISCPKGAGWLDALRCLPVSTTSVTIDTRQEPLKLGRAKYINIEWQPSERDKTRFWLAMSVIVEKRAPDAELLFPFEVPNYKFYSLNQLDLVDQILEDAMQRWPLLLERVIGRYEHEVREKIRHALL